MTNHKVIKVTALMITLTILAVFAVTMLGGTGAGEAYLAGFNSIP